MIAAERLTKRYNDTNAVNDISFEVKEGETLILLGTSGCGKTTTLRMLNRLIAPTAGKVLINGKDVQQQDVETLRRGIGYVLQHNSLFPHYTVAENIAVVPTLLKWDKQKIQQRTETLMAQLHLSMQLMQSYPHELSGGQQQRVNIARALAANPPVLLMDEPFGALDTITRSNIVREFSELEELTSKTIVMVTHDVDEAFRLGDKICLMNEGRIVQQGAPAELIFNPASDFVREFFASSYLRLALSAVRVRDVWDSLADAHETQTQLQDDATLWMVMEQMVQQQADGPITIGNTQGAVKKIDKQQLFAAISKR